MQAISGHIITAPVKEFCDLSGLGRTRVYELIASGELESITIGRRRLIVLDSYRRLIERRHASGEKLLRPSAKVAQ
jgi:excisionase family DNA binding protein